jgi:ferric-dicitrate binding protein FerR (iron transport regulator)
MNVMHMQLVCRPVAGDTACRVSTHQHQAACIAASQHNEPVLAGCYAQFVSLEYLAPQPRLAGVLAEKDAELETANGQLKRALESLQRLEETHKQVGGHAAGHEGPMLS